MRIFYRLIALTQLLFLLIILPEIFKLIYPSEPQGKLFYVFSLQFVHLITWLIVNGYYCIFYKLQIPFAEQFKIEKLNWPWQQNQEEWIAIRNKTILNFVQHIITGTLLALVLSFIVIKTRLDRDSFPSIQEVFSQIIFNGICEDILFYTTHRLLHTPSLYKFHKQHHEYNVTISISAEYSTELEYLLGNVIPAMAGPTILGSRVHIITTWTWIALRIAKTLQAHSGYKFPWDAVTQLPYITDSEYHSFHHSYNQGNYGSLYRIWDYIFNTNIEYNKLKKSGKYGLIDINKQS
ncbi:hypothetical protein pb186bvf_009621 [Paramecium bursaria]